MTQLEFIVKDASCSDKQSTKTYKKSEETAFVGQLLKTTANFLYHKSQGKSPTIKDRDDQFQVSLQQ